MQEKIQLDYKEKYLLENKQDKKTVWEWTTSY